MGEFNEAQVAAIKHKKGPMLVLAGAGSGKTTVLTYRIKNLIMNREVNPKNILHLQRQQQKKWKNVSML